MVKSEGVMKENIWNQTVSESQMKEIQEKAKNLNVLEMRTKSEHVGHVATEV